MRGSRGSTGKRRRGEEAPCDTAVRSAHIKAAHALGLAVDDNELQPPRRLSRHIPNRSGMDMELASYNLTDPGPAAPCGHPQAAVPQGIAAGSSVADSSANGGGGGSSSFLSDDSTYMASLYKERLATSLNSGTAKIGGEVLRFGAERHSAGGKSSRNASGRHHMRDLAASAEGHHGVGGPHGAAHLGRDLRLGSGAVVGSGPVAGGGGVGSHGGKLRRVVCPNPERVLDAPDLPRNAWHMMEWGSNNRIAIGIRSTLYEYDPVGNEARKIVEMSPTSVIRSVHWFFKCSCVCMGMLNQPVANFFDMRSERFIRNLQVPGSISAIAVNGSMATIASAAGNAFVFDLRCREPAVATIEAHRDRVTALDYRRAEPNYLASGSTDGIVKVWDDRKWGFPVYTLDKAHHPQAAVMALHWNPDKRTTIFSGDSHGMLHLLDTHGDAARSSPQANVATSAAVARLCSPAQGVNTGAPITAIVSAAGSSEVATAHRNPGQIQVRRVATFQHVATFSSQSSNGEPIISMSLSPDKERICAAQLDETLKFWKVFDDQSSGNQAGRGARRPSTCGDFSSQFHEDLR